MLFYLTFIQLKMHFACNRRPKLIIKLFALMKTPVVSTGSGNLALFDKWQIPSSLRALYVHDVLNGT